MKKITYSYAGNRGCLERYNIAIENAEKHVEELDDLISYGAKIIAPDMIQVETNKSDRAKLETWVIKTNRKNELANNPKKTGHKNSTKYVELADVAIENDLPHGRCWTATLYHIDKFQLDPSWDGEEICYVYPE